MVHHYEAIAKDDVDDITETLEKTKISKHVNLTRTFKDNPLVHYTQQLVVKKETLNLHRGETAKPILYVAKASSKDNSKTHLLAQGVCMSNETIWTDILTTKLFPEVSKSQNKTMDWVSEKSETKPNKTHFIRKPQTKYFGGHAEPQLISDIEDQFMKNSDAVVSMFIPPPNNKEDIYICGLEVFGPYDMCDDYNGNGKNKYNCVGKLLDFRKCHQNGQRSISKAIQEKLKGKFKGSKEDAFVVIYHTQSPYDKVDTYKAEDEDYRYGLSFSFDKCSFSRSKDFDDTYQLSQSKSLSTEPDVLYGYIHQLGDKAALYQTTSKRFCFC